MSAPARRGAYGEHRSLHMLLAIVGVSALAHAAALGALLMFVPAPYVTPQEVIEISLVPAPRADGPFGAIGGDRADVSVPPASERRAVPPAASSPDWFRRLDMGHTFEMPGATTFGVHTPAPAFDTLAAAHDCLATGRAMDRASRGAQHPHAPCTWDDPPLPSSLTAQRSASATRPNEVGNDGAYRTFKTIQPLYDESLFPDEAPPTKRAFRNWLADLLR